MKFRNIFTSGKVFSSVFAITSALIVIKAASAQSGPPKQEMLLNGLKVLMWSDPKADDVSVRVRIHSGSAFDPQGKEGVMQMLADSFFPNEAAREFFSEDLGGSLEIRTTYDYIEIAAKSKPQNFLTLLETVATAVSNPQIDKETTAKIRSALLKKVETLESDPSYIADMAIAHRLFGTFPYGRPQTGNAASLQKIDFADLIDARQRFITADNATVAVVGNFDRALGFRAIRRYFGSWLKSDRKVPSTFKQPDAPTAAELRITSPKAAVVALRFAVRGSARGGKDYAASEIAAAAVGRRLRARVPSVYANGISIANHTHVLPGMMMIRLDTVGEHMPARTTEKELVDIVSKSLSEPFTQAELDAARRSSASEKRDLATVWLDADTYKFDKPEANASALDSVTLGDVNDYIERLRKLPMAFVVVGPAAT